MKILSKLNDLYLNKKTIALQIEHFEELNKKSNKLETNSKSNKLLENEIINLSKNIIKLTNETKQIESIINTLNQPSKLILILKYEKNYSIGEIAQELNYSTKRIYQLHNIALNDFNKKYNQINDNKEIFDK